MSAFVGAPCAQRSSSRRGPGLAQAVERTVRADQGSTPPSPAKAAARYQEISKDLSNQIAQREARLPQVRAELDAVAPGLGEAVAGRVVAIQDFLASKMPQVPERRACRSTSNASACPATARSPSFALHERAATDPLSVFEDARKGRLRPEGPETLRVLYPTMCQALGSATLAQVASKTERLTYDQRVGLALLFPDLPVDPSMEPKAIRAYQSAQIQGAEPLSHREASRAHRPRPRLSPATTSARPTRRPDRSLTHGITYPSPVHRCAAPRQGRMLAFATSDTCAFLDLSAEMPWGVGDRPDDAVARLLRRDPGRGVRRVRGAREDDGTDIAAAGVSAAADDPQEDVGMMVPAGQTIHAWIEEGAWKYLAYVCRSGETERSGSGPALGASCSDWTADHEPASTRLVYAHRAPSRGPYGVGATPARPHRHGPPPARRRCSGLTYPRRPLVGCSPRRPR